MGFIRFLLWTSLCIGLGIFAASYEVDGKTPVQHVKQIWKQSPHSVEGTIEKAKKSLVSHEETGPSEQHSDSDRDAINRLVAKRTK
jgi:hypothetical protein